MRCIDLFAGAGGLSEGFKRAGFEVLAHVEMDPFAALTLKTREAYYYLKENNMLDIYRSYLLGNITRDNLYASIPENILKKIICNALVMRLLKAFLITLIICLCRVMKMKWMF